MSPARPNSVYGTSELVRTTSIDEAQAAIRRTYLGVYFELAADTTPLDFRLEVLHLGTSTAARLGFGADVMVRCDKSECFFINLPLTGASVSRDTRGRRVHTLPGEAVIFSPGDAIESAWSNTSTQLCLVVPVTAIQEELTELLGRALTEPLRFELELNLKTAIGRDWRSLMELIIAAFDNNGGIAEPPSAARHLERLLLSGLLIGQQHNYNEMLSKPGSPGAVLLAIHMLEDDPARGWTSAELAREVYISVRALQEGFRRMVGVPPMAYLRNVRLSRVHDELRAALPGSVKVNDVASRFGFQHMSRFAGAYRDRYGTNPSATLHST